MLRIRHCFYTMLYSDNSHPVLDVEASFHFVLEMFLAGDQQHYLQLMLPYLISLSCDQDPYFKLILSQ